MPTSLTVHYNPPNQGYKTRCGLPLRTHEHRKDIKDVTCNNCIRCEGQSPTEPIA